MNSKARGGAHVLGLGGHRRPAWRGVGPRVEHVLLWLDVGTLLDNKFLLTLYFLLRLLELRYRGGVELDLPLRSLRQRGLQKLPLLLDLLLLLLKKRGLLPDLIVRVFHLLLRHEIAGGGGQIGAGVDLGDGLMSRVGLKGDVGLVSAVG